MHDCSFKNYKSNVLSITLYIAVHALSNIYKLGEGDNSHFLSEAVRASTKGPLNEMLIISGPNDLTIRRLQY